MQPITTEELQRALAGAEVTPVFVLSKFLFEKMHIPGTINIPEEHVEERFPVEFEEDEEIILYCASESCQAAPRVGQKLRSMGYHNVKEYEPGLEGWRERGLPLEGNAVSETT